VIAQGQFARCLILTGPTGSGKSSLALEIAPQLNAEIVAMDSMTLYRGMDIGTAKPTRVERAAVPHHLIDVLDPWESANVAWWLESASAAVRDIECRGRVALFVGGTPLYLKALLRGIFAGPGAHPEVRRRLEEEARIVGVSALHARLADLDPVAGTRIHPNDLRRIVRALEVRETTGAPISEMQLQWKAEGGLRTEVLCLDVPRAELYEKIDRRVRVMLDQGWLEEARSLWNASQPPSREASAAVGYRDLWAYLDGQADWPTTVARIQQRTRQYAKRQLTWFRHLPECRFVTPELTRKHWEMTMG
jgi:tRNA dimethylallyltransferase